ncbi:MAG: AraC family transcriptional regulator [Bacteroidales bacterium]|jgi:AraC-like DNA-binding protein/quercetin dioxygenase-like cupin family protein
MQITYEKLVIDENSLFHYQEFIQPRFTSSFHLHDEFELIVIVKSHGKLYVGNNVTNFNDGDLFLFAPGLPHCFYNTRGYENGNVPAHAVGVFFKKDFLGSGFFEKTEASQLSRLINKAESGVQIMNPSETIINKIIALNKKSNLERVGELLLILNEMAGIRNLNLLSRTDNSSASSLIESKVINDVYKYVAENFQKKITFAMAASVANMQKAAFCRYFKRKTKKKFTGFVNETRIMHARKLLAETDKSITEVAFSCGYENTSYFNRQFRLYCNIPPTVFREQVRQK